MKSLSNLINKTPWWALLLGGFTLAVALALFVTPFHLIRLNKSGATAEENRAIKREVDLTFSEGAIDIAGKVVREMRDHTRDPARREELDRALEEIQGARLSMREAGAEVLRAKRAAADSVTEAVQEAARAIGAAQKEAARAMKDAGVEDGKLTQSLEASMAAAKQAEAEALRGAEEARGATPKPEKNRIVIMSPGKKKPFIDIEIDRDDLKGLGPVPPLPPEVRSQIREKVAGDLWRIGVGSGLILLFIPLFILAIVSKFFIDRSRASERMAELTSKEAEFHRMRQQVTEAKLAALQAQVEPHFLYNTLASVQALTEVDPRQASAMTGHLIQYLRNALPKMRESVSTVGQEVELVRAYLNILQMRMGARLAFDIAVPAELMEAPFPPLMLPSLVENAIKHGLEPMREGGEVRISAETEGGMLRLTVADTGRGFAEPLGAGVGLANIRERLAAMYGGAARLTLMAREPQGVAATIEVPREGAPRAVGSNPSQPDVAAQTAIARSATARTLAAMGSAERAWRKGLTFTFMVLVIVAAVAAGLAALGVMTGTLPVQLGDDAVGGAAGAFIGTAGITAGFAVVVLALAIVLAVVYGLGFLFVGIAIFVPLVVLVALFPVMAPFLLLGLGIWWLVRRRRRRAALKAQKQGG